MTKFDLRTNLQEVREADRGRTLQAEGTGRAEALRWSMPGTSEEQKRKAVVVTGLNEEEK